MEKLTIKITIICTVLLLVLAVAPASATTWDIYPTDPAKTVYNITTTQARPGDTYFFHAGEYNASYGVGVMASCSEPRYEGDVWKGEGPDLVTYDLGDISGNTMIDAKPRKVWEGFTFENVEYIEIVYTANSVLRNCVIKCTDDGSRGLWVRDNSHDCVIENCVIDGVTSCITIEGSNTTFESNTVINSSYISINANNCMIANNTITNATSTSGAIKNKLSGCTIVNNKIINSAGPGITLINTAAKDNLIAYNNFSNNAAGIWFYKITGVNTIYANNFVENRVTAVPYSSTAPALTHWNSTEPLEYTYNGVTRTGYLGNYYSDYAGADADGDGIGDTPYVLPNGLGTDYAPLMAGFENYEMATEPETPEANFSASPLSGDVPLTVQFTDLSTGDGISSWTWDFDSDGNVDSTEQNPIWIYTNAGTYTISLTVTNEEGSDIETKAGYVTVNESAPALTANFSASPLYGNAPLTVQFTDLSTGNGISSWTWDFDSDGNVDSTEQNPSYTFNYESNYTVTLTATGTCGSDTEVKADYINVSKASEGTVPQVYELTDADWPNFQKDNWNTGITAERAPIAYPDMNTSWDSKSGGTNAAPLVIGDKVIIAGVDVKAYNRTSGELLWSGNLDKGGLGNPAYGNGMVFVPTANGSIYAFDVFSGEEIWHVQAGTDETHYQIDTPIVYSEHRLYFGEAMGGHRYYCLDDARGEEIWSRTSTTQNSKEGSYYWAGAAVIGDYLVYGDDDGHLCSVNKYDGSTIQEIIASSSQIRSSVTYVEETGTIYFTSKDLYCYSLGFNITEGTFDTSNKHKAYIGYSTSTPAVYNNRLYVGTGSFGGACPLRCLNATDLTEIWNFTITGGIQSSPAISTYYDDGDGEVYIYFVTNTLYGSLYCLKDCEGSAEAEEMWHYTPPSGKNQYVLGSVAISDGWVYFGNNIANEAGGYFFAFNAPEIEAPVANFSADPISGNVPLNVQFMDLSTYVPVSWYWDFGDGATATDQNPSHTYTSAGTYTVNLTVVNAAGSDSEVKTDCIVVSTPETPDTTDPVINSAFLFPANTTASSTTTISVNANDDVEVTGVMADNVTLIKSSDAIWKGSITAPSSLGDYSLQITAKDAAGNTAETSVPYHVVQLSGGANVAVSPRSSSVAAGNNTTLNLKVKNTQNIDDIFKVIISVSELPASYQTDLSWFNWNERVVTLRAGEEILIPVEMAVPEGSTAGRKLFRANVNSETSSITGFDTGYLTIS